MQMSAVYRHGQLARRLQGRQSMSSARLFTVLVGLAVPPGSPEVPARRCRPLVNGAIYGISDGAFKCYAARKLALGATYGNAVSGYRHSEFDGRQPVRCGGCLEPVKRRTKVSAAGAARQTRVRHVRRSGTCTDRKRCEILLLKSASGKHCLSAGPALNSPRPSPRSSSTGRPCGCRPSAADRAGRRLS